MWLFDSVYCIGMPADVQFEKMFNDSDGKQQLANKIGINISVNYLSKNTVHLKQKSIQIVSTMIIIISISVSTTHRVVFRLRVLCYCEFSSLETHSNARSTAFSSLNWRAGLYCSHAISITILSTYLLIWNEIILMLFAFINGRIAYAVFSLSIFPFISMYAVFTPWYFIFHLNYMPNT